MSDKNEYDPGTCVTAQKLRDVGIDIPDTVPDCAWVPRASIQVGNIDVKDQGDGFFSCDIVSVFTEPFQWFTLTVAVSKVKADG